MPYLTKTFDIHPSDMRDIVRRSTPEQAGGLLAAMAEAIGTEFADENAAKAIQAMSQTSVEQAERLLAMRLDDIVNGGILLHEIRTVQTPTGKWNNILAIKEHRRLTGSDIKTAKDYVEAHCRDLIRAQKQADASVAQPGPGMGNHL